MNKENKKSKLIKIILIIIVLFYFIFLYIDFFSVKTFISSNIIKFISMILILSITLLTGKDSLSTKDNFLLKVGIFITVIADILLLLVDNYYIIGIGLFSIVQITYSIRYDFKNRKNIIRNFTIIFIVLSLIYILTNTFIIKIDFTILISLYYAICLVSSTIKGINTYKDKKYPKLNSIMITLGMILFLLCDVNVAANNILSSLSISNKFISVFINISFFSMWFFYLPSQVLLSLSGYKSSFLKMLFSKKFS